MLNKNQQLAVENKGGPMLIVAGAGTGKTTVITERIKFLIDNKLAKPDEILALTFTEKAASEMEERVDKILPYGTFGMWIMTFHSFCDRILRNEVLSIGLVPNFKLMTEAQSQLFVKKNFWKFELKDFRPLGNPYKFIQGMLQHFSRLKDEDVLPGDYRNEENQELVEAYKTYEDLKIKEGVMDFSDLISNTLIIFRTRKNILGRYQKKFKYILVDEFQDTNLAQYQLVRLLAADDSNITVVADDDQSVYKFRGAAVSNVLQFRKDYPGSKTIVLAENYRSTQQILDSAYNLIQNNNPDRLEIVEKIDKKLVSKSQYLGEKPDFNFFETGEDEAGFVVKKIRELLTVNSELAYKDFAILVRSNSQADVFIKALDKEKIPFQFLGPGQLFKQQEVTELISYLRFLSDFNDNVSLYQVVSMDVFHFSQRDIIGWLSKSKKLNLSLFEFIESLDGTRKFIEMVHRHLEMVSKETAGQILYDFLECSGYLANIIDYKNEPEEKIALNIVKFFDIIRLLGDGNLLAVVDYLNAAIDLGESPLASQTDWSQNNAVNILTLHSAKGLEFPVVFLVNLVDGRFPSRERKDQIPIPDVMIKEILPTGDEHVEEERRLFYVGMTRAKQQLFMTAAKYYGDGKRERKISLFVIEALGENGSQSTVHSSQTQIPLFEWSKKDVSTVNREPVTIVNYLSYSAIETFKICPLHYKMRVILGIQTPMTSAQALGNSIHLVLNQYYHPDQTKKTLDKMLDLLNKNWISDGYETKKHQEDGKEKAEEFLTKYFNSAINKSANPKYLETPINFKLVDDLKIGGKIDRVDDLGNGEIEIIDYKTGKVPKQKEIDESMQMSIYALAASILWGYHPDKIKLSFYFFESGEKISTLRTEKQLEAAKQEILKVRSDIRLSDFRCQGSIICQKCEFKLLCNHA